MKTTEIRCHGVGVLQRPQRSCAHSRPHHSELSSFCAVVPVPSGSILWPVIASTLNCKHSPVLVICEGLGASHLTDAFDGHGERMANNSHSHLIALSLLQAGQSLKRAS